MKAKLIHMSRLTKFAFWAESVLSQFAGFLIQFFTPLAPFILVTTLLVFIDQFTGRRAAKKRGEQITSGGMKRTIEKLALYLLSLVAAEAVYRVFLMQSIPQAHLTYGVAAQIAFTELKSNLENVGEVTGTKINLITMIRFWKR